MIHKSCDGSGTYISPGSITHEQRRAETMPCLWCGRLVRITPTSRNELETRWRQAEHDPLVPAS